MSGDGSMWKPGAAKPSPSDADNNNNKRGRDGSNNEDDEDTSHNLNGTSQSPPSGTPSSEKKTAASLSGATMNMRFMQRKKEQQNFEKKHQQKVEVASPMDVDGDNNNNEDGEGSDDSDIIIDAQQPRDGLVSSTPATTADMYGVSVEVIGRRSFGGFNRAIEDTWKESYRSYKDGSQRTSRGGDRASDEELLKRYANLVKDRRGDGDKSRSPIGNLGNKGNRNKPRSGDKRKRR